MKKLYDKKNREILPYDLLKIFHFIGPKHKKYYMYKLVEVKQNSLWGSHLSQCGGGYWLHTEADKNGVIQTVEIVQRGGPFLYSKGDII